MKRIKIKLDEILSIESLVDAFYKSKKTKKNRRDIRDFEARLGYEISSLYKELKNGSYEPSPSCVFKVYEPKERDIFQPKLRDLVVQRMIYEAIYKAVDKKLYYYTYGVRKLRGMHEAGKIAQRYMSANKYYAQFDIRKYFLNIQKEALRCELSRYFKDKKLVELMLKFCGDGVNIGNLLSGIFGMLFLARFDSYVKRELGAKKYIRFMDDFVIFDLSLEQCKWYKEKIECFLASVGLSLSKAKINKNMCNFVGFRITPHYRLIRKRSIKTYKKAKKKGDNVVMKSILGLAKGSASYEYLKAS